MTYLVKTEVGPQRVCDMIIGAFEGGSNYWIENRRVELVVPTYENLPGDKTLIWYARPELYAEPFKIMIQSYGSIDPQAVTDGLNIMASKYGRHFTDLIQENDDADTADVFLQCCLFGDIIYA